MFKFCDELEAEEQKLETLENRFIENLPKSILQAAVQGKLVLQNIKDESATLLLERTHVEKARLIQIGKLKREKPLPLVSEKEIPYDLPIGWVWCRLSDITTINPRNYLADETKISFVPMTLISSKYSGGHDQENRVWGEVKNSFTHFAEGDVALAKITPCFQNGKSCLMINLFNGYGAGTTELHVLRSISVLPEYLLIYLKTPEFLAEGEKNMTGTAGQQRVPTEYLKKCLVPLPPLAEPLRIVAKVDELMAFCNELEAVKTLSFEKIDTTLLGVIQFPIQKPKSKELLQLVARGGISEEPSEEFMQAIDDLFEGDI